MPSSELLAEMKRRGEAHAKHLTDAMAEWDSEKSVLMRAYFNERYGFNGKTFKTFEEWMNERA